MLPKSKSNKSAGFTSRLAKQSLTQSGFTLIELLIVVAIIAILISLGAASYTTAQRKGRDTQRITDLKVIQAELAKYYADGNQYPANDPADTTGGTRFNCVSGNVTWSNSTQVNAFSCTPISGGTSKTYLSDMPKDPLARNSWPTYCYKSASANQTFTLYARLEIAPASGDVHYQDPSVTICGTTGYNYKVDPTN
ncbi:MAG: prepilin-type N-terminal cleavage/methylation domain-containing protein [bacterium]|nr:prepilin-type N-terminal cleavage/methylation domain-containing protein [bacterium]